MLLGNIPSKIDARRRLRVPIEFRYYLSATFGFEMLAVPLGERVTLCPLSERRRFIDDWFEAIKVSTIGTSLSRHLSHSSVKRSRAYYTSEAPSRELSTIQEDLKADCRRHRLAIEKMTGPEFERYLRRRFEDHGLSVQANVRLFGADVDLLLIEAKPTQTPRYIIVECKQYGGSQRRVSLSQVMRLHSLREALRSTNATRFGVADGLLITSTDVTKPARHFCEAFGLAAMSHRELLDWLEKSTTLPGAPSCPVVTKIEMSASGNVTLAPALIDYLKIDTSREVTVLGAVNVLEVWSREALLRSSTLEFSDEDWKILAENCL